MVFEKSPLTIENLYTFARAAGISEEDIAIMQEFRQTVVNDPELLKNYTELFDILHSNSNTPFTTDKYPEISEFTCKFRLLLALSWIPCIINSFRKKHFPEKVLTETMHDINTWVKHCRRNYGFTGLHKWATLYWLSGHARGTLVQLGRLQFNIEAKFLNTSTVFRNRRSGELLALAGDNIIFDNEGLPHLEEVPQCWRSSYKETNASAAGNPVSCYGITAKEPVTLNFDQWEKVLAPGDPVINIHIPELGPMTVEACSDSVAQAAAFAAEYYPDHHWKAINVTSWFNDPLYERYLPESSNIIKFHTAGYLLPEALKTDPVVRVFPGTEPFDGGSTLQKAVYKMLQDGISGCRATLILLREDLPWRENVYRTKENK